MRMRSVLRVFALAAGVAVLAVGALLESPGSAQGALQIVFAAGPDGSGALERRVRDFNEAHRGEIEVVWREMPDQNDAHRRALLRELESRSAGIDVFATDVVWTGALARSGRVEDLTDRFHAAYDRAAFLPAALRSATHRLRIWGVPWYADAGLLFYRRDLLAQHGFDTPPATWAELASMAQTVTDASDVPHGFVFQGAVSEAGTANAAEFIWSAGGDIVTSRLAVTGTVVRNAAEVHEVRVRSAAAARGLDIARGLVADGIAPAEVADFQEADALAAFQSGKAVFLRSWPYAYRVLRRGGLSGEQVGVAGLPAADRGGRGASCLGGWNLMLNARSSRAKRDAGWAWIRYLTGADQQRQQAKEAGLLPVLEALYEDAALRRAVPVIRVGTRVFAEQLRERPTTPHYDALSERVATAFHRTLRGELTGAEATRLLDRQLRRLLARNR